MNRIVSSVVVLAFAASVAGCENKSQPVEPAAAPSAVPPAPPAEPPPTVADFEEEAASQITSDNVDQELDKLEKEIAD